MWRVVRSSCLAGLGALFLWVLVTVFAWRLLIVYPTLLETHEVLTHAPVIAVLVGDTYFRAEKAAALYFGGYGNEIWFTGDPSSSGGASQSKRCLEETHNVP